MKTTVDIDKYGLAIHLEAETAADAGALVAHAMNQNAASGKVFSAFTRPEAVTATIHLRRRRDNAGDPVEHSLIERA